MHFPAVSPPAPSTILPGCRKDVVKKMVVVLPTWRFSPLARYLRVVFRQSVTLNEPRRRRRGMKASGLALAGKAGYALGCVAAALVLVASGVGYYAQHQADVTGNSAVAMGGPSTGAMNILVMGLESRTYWSGKPLPRYLTNLMHVGNNGGNATNTL